MKSLPFGKPIIDEKEQAALLEVLASGIYVHGPKVNAFEAGFSAFTGAPYSVAVANCTAALHLLYFNWGFGPGDEVIVPAQTHTATAHAVELTGAKPVFIDAEAETGNIDISKLESLITPRTKAISVVHYLGMPVNMEAVCAIAERHQLKVVEDCALAIGSYYKNKHAGLWGDAGCYSFYPVKHMTTGEGGMVITNSAELSRALHIKRAFGMDKHVGERKHPGVYDVQGLGFNYRMSEFEAAMGVCQVEKMPAILAARKLNFHRLYDRLNNADGVSMLKSTGGDYQSSYYCLAALLDNNVAEKRFEIMEKLKLAGIGTSIYYPSPVPFMSYYKEKYGYKGTEFPVAKSISDRIIALPVGAHLNSDDMDYIADHFIKALQESK